jgi:sulfur dioxygenase
VRRSYAGLLEIDPEWVAEHLAEVHVLDVRQPEELEDKLGHIAAAQCVPLNQLKDRLAEIPKDKPVIPVCHAGMRSGQATVLLRDAGFPRVANLRGGMLLWQQMGLPVLPVKALYRSKQHPNGIKRANIPFEQPIKGGV